MKRSEERRVGKECRSRWSTYHDKKMNVIDALGVDKPDVMGGSIAGRIVKNMAVSDASRFSAHNGLESAAYTYTEAAISAGLGHFPMREDPALFLSYLRPVLADILKRGSNS